MPLNPEQTVEFCDDLINWYWNLGVRREQDETQKDFAVDTGDWLKQLYNKRKELVQVQEAAKNLRPAIAIWGPSQTGKSTLVSSYIDANACTEINEGVAGKGSGLHWGEKPAFFMLPEAALEELKNKPRPSWLTVLNPFNAKKDASAVLTRFVFASERGEGGYRVVALDYPVELYLVRERELLHALARGYDTECLGRPLSWQPAHWTSRRFLEALDSFNADPDRRPSRGRTRLTPNRQAYEFIHDFCEVLNHLVSTNLDRFVELKDEGEAAWNSTLNSLLKERCLIAKLEWAKEFAARILWDASPVLTKYYERLSGALREYQGVFGNRPVHCDLQVASLLLDMDAYDRFVREPGSLPRLAYRITDERVFLGSFSDERAKPIMRSPEEFAVFQGLVWEMVVPLKADNLNPSPFKEFLSRADLLDFPGVGNEAANEVTKVRVFDLPTAGPATQGAPVALSQAAAEAPPGRVFSPEAFFAQILKRGKTASMVATYAERLTIDGFCIFLALDFHAPVNAMQLVKSIGAWWQCMFDDYKPGEGKSPLPLNLAICWWAAFLEDAEAVLGKDREPLRKKKSVLDSVGCLADPAVADIFALNYWTFSRGTLKKKEYIADPGSAVVQTIMAEECFSSLFKDHKSIESFRKMLTDKRTGGTDFFFSELCRQVEELVHRRDQGVGARRSRASILAEKRRVATPLLEALAVAPIPPPVTRDVRRENLRRFKEHLLLDAIEGKSETELRSLNHALREFLDVSSDSLYRLPVNADEVTEKFIRQQFKKWLDGKVEGYARWLGQRGKSKPDWSLLGVTEATFRQYLQALVDSLGPEQGAANSLFEEIAEWLRRLIIAGPGPLVRSVDLHPALAIKMANVLVYGPAGIRAYVVPDTSGIPSTPPTGKDCPSYKEFIQPFAERQLQYLHDRRIGKREPVAVLGTPELRQLCARYNVSENPASSSVGVVA